MVNYLLYFTGTAIINQFIDETKVTELRVSTKRMIYAKLTASTQLRVNPKLMINNKLMVSIEPNLYPIFN